MLHNFREYAKNLIKFIKTGGIVYAKVSQIHHGSLLKNKRVLITGGSSGIGLSIAKKFVSEGAKVLITGRDSDKLESALKELNKEAQSLIWDVSDLDISKTKSNEAISMLGDIDILVNNAGIYSRTNFLDITTSEWKKIMDTNIGGSFFICQSVVEYFLNQRKKGKIISILSNRGLQGDYSPYGISKWAGVGFMKGLALSLAPKGIIVNGIAPGTTATDINNLKSHDSLFTTSESLDSRIALPEEIAEIALFLASDASNHIIGQIITCDGGARL